MTDTKATLAEEGLRVERPSGWYWVKHHYLPNDWLPAEWSLKHKCWFSRACRIVYDSDFTAIGQRIFPPDHPTPPAVEASDLERARSFRQRGAAFATTVDCRFNKALNPPVWEVFEMTNGEPISNESVRIVASFND